MFVSLLYSFIIQMAVLSTPVCDGSQTNGTVNSIDRLRIGAWNMNCNTDISGPFLNEMAKYCHVIVTSEHGLYQNQLHKLDHIIPNFKSFAMPSDHRDASHSNNMQGIGGVAVLWNTEVLSFRVKKLPGLSSDRIAVIELKADDARYFIISVYLPHQTCLISDFDIELRKLRKVLDECMPKGHCLILGDTNVQFPEGYDLRTWGVSNRNTPKLHALIQSYDMYVADIGYKAHGSNVTFVGGNGCSYVDHIIVPQCLVPYITDCFVMGECISNVSDHSPVFIELAISINQTYSSDKNGRRIAWNRMSDGEIHESYTEPLDLKVMQLINDCGFDISTPEEIDELDPISDQAALADFVEKITNAIKSVSEPLAKNTFKKFQKPWWNETLDDLVKAKKQARAAWINAGKKKHLKEYDAYKTAKKEFRRQLRRYKFEYELAAMNDFTNSQDIDARYFWYLVNRHKNVKIANPVVSDSGTILTDPDDIRDDWTSYYENLYKECSDESYDDNFKGHIESELLRMRSSTRTHENMLTGGKIIPAEVLVLIKNLKNNKAAGWDGITAEELKNMGPIGVSALTWLYNSIIHQIDIPLSLKKGLLVPIPKPDKDSSVKDNNRGITLLPVLYKLLEKIIIERENTWFVNENIIDVLQSSGKEKCSCLHTSFLVQEAIAYGRNRDCPVHGASLDARKAFDTVWIEGLMFKLRKAGMNPTAVGLLENAYTDFSCAVFINGKTGRWFLPERGVHQGAPASMILYVAYMNDLIIEVRDSNLGIIVFNINLSCPCHADDVFLLSLYKMNMNRLLYIVYRYSVMWRYSFNIDKTKYLMWGKDNDPLVDICFGGDVIQPSDVCKHMGLDLCTKPGGVDKMIDKRAGKVKTVMSAAQGLGDHQLNVPPLTLSRIYWAVGVPKLTYGLDVTHVDNNCLNKLENIHRQNAKLVQSLPTNTHTPAPLATIGWISMYAHIAIAKIMFIIRILCLGDDSLHRQFLVIRLNMMQRNPNIDEKYVSPTLSCWNFVKTYNMENVVLSFIDNGDSRRIASTKRLVKMRVKEVEETRWRYSCMLYSELAIYSDIVTCMKPLAWWSFVQVCPTYFKKAAAVVTVLMNGQPKYLQCNFDSDICKLCIERERDVPTHILFQCSALQDTRLLLSGPLFDCMPYAMRLSFTNMSSIEKLRFMLSGMSIEFRDVMMGISNYIFAMYKRRKELYDTYNVP